MLGYLIAVLATIAVTFVRTALHPWIGSEAPLVPFELSVTVSAWIGGLGPGMVATIGSALAGAYFFFEPRHTWAINNSADCLHVILFCITGLCISVLSERMLAALVEQKRIQTEREALLASEQAARAEAERAGKSKDDFVAMVSHELRTPLTAILGWAQLLRKRPPTPEQLGRALEVIERNAELQTRLVSDLLDVSRIASGKIHLDIRTVDMRETVEAALESVRHASEAKRIEIHASLDPAGARVVGDPARLQQIFWNLLSNAIKFTPQGGRVDVSLARVDGRIRFAVRDTGEGMAPEFLPMIFDRFRQADSSLARRYGGLGLGLSIAKHFVELHGGSIHATSEGVGKGALLTVHLPLEAPAGADAQSDHVTPSAPDAHERSLSGVEVLVVDDAPDALDLVKRLLEERGAKVVTARSAAEALDMLKTVVPDVLVSDIGMPEKDGYALIRDIRTGAREAVRNVPAMALTAFARTEDRDLALSIGYQAHLTKPVEPMGLVATVARLASAANHEPPPDVAS